MQPRQSFYHQQPVLSTAHPQQPRAFDPGNGLSGSDMPALLSAHRTRPCRTARGLEPWLVLFCKKPSL
jgi:hypothetical protein